MHIALTMAQASGFLTLFPLDTPNTEPKSQGTPYSVESKTDPLTCTSISYGSVKQSQTKFD